MRRPLSSERDVHIGLNALQGDVILRANAMPDLACPLRPPTALCRSAPDLIWG